VLQVEDVWYHYYAGAPVLQGVNLEVQAGEWVALMGCNGSGKSTLVKHFNGLLRPLRGRVMLGGQDAARRSVGELARSVGYMPQNPDRLIFSATVWDEVAFGPRQHGLAGAELETAVAESLEMLDLASLAQVPPAVLGYGQRRQVGLAAVLATRPSLLVLDEPTVGLDAGNIGDLMQVVEGMRAKGTAVVVITHDLGLAAERAGRVVLLQAGRVLGQGGMRQILTDRDLLADAGLVPLPITRLAALLSEDLPGFPTDLLTPAELSEAYLRRRSGGMPT
jgi:energy-coupling factor transporter ATP-binding protein EcfA2